MRKFVKFVLVSGLILFVGIPCAIVLLVLGSAALGIALGIGGWIVGMMFAVLKVALMILLPLLLIGWVVRRVFAPEHTY